MPKINIAEMVEKEQLRDDIPRFGPGDLVKGQVRVKERSAKGQIRERNQAFQGRVISRRGAGVRESFTVRKDSFGVGVERTFPVHSPVIASIEVLQRGNVRRAKLYYLRGRVGRAARIKEKRD